MRASSTTSDLLAAEVAGTTSGDELVVTAWRDGAIVAEGLEVAAWSLDWDTGRQVRGQASFTFADPDGVLAPWGLSDPLGPGGSRLQVFYRFGASGTVVPLGWWRIRQPSPTEQWRTYKTGSDVRRVSGGGTVTVAADEETCSLVMDRFDPGSRIPTKTSVIDEITYLVGDYMAVWVDPAIVDKTVPSKLTYDEGRLDAVERLLDMLSATHRMSGEQVMEILPMSGAASVWTIDGGEDGALVNVNRSLSDDGIYNAVFSTGQTSEGAPLVGRAYVSAGPTAWEGPFGRVPAFHEAIATSSSGVQKDAETYLANRKAAGEVELSVDCLTHPGLQVHDMVTVVAASVAGDQALVGRVTSMHMAAATMEAGTVPAKRMSLTVAVPADMLETIGRRVADAR